MTVRSVGGEYRSLSLLVVRNDEYSYLPSLGHSHDFGFRLQNNIKGKEVSLPYVQALIKEVHHWVTIGNLDIPHATTMPASHQEIICPRE
jgi:hypothetical protein